MLYGSIPAVGDRISRLVLGSAGLVSTQLDQETTLLDTFVAAGGTALDTARSYGDSEAAIGSWLKRRGRHDDLTIITKGVHPITHGTPRVTPAAIESDLAQSLATLGVDRIDLLLLHRDDPTQPVGPIMETLNTAVVKGQIRGAGASNWSTARIDEANAYAAQHGLAGFVAGSPNLALAVSSEPMWPDCISVAGDAAALAWYRERQYPLLSWSSQASGFFSGRFAPDTVTDPHVARVYYRPDNWERLRRARELAASRGCTPTQVALAWVLHQPFPTFALIGPRTLPELEDCLGAVDVELTDAEGAWLNLEGGG